MKLIDNSAKYAGAYHIITIIKISFLCGERPAFLAKKPVRCMLISFFRDCLIKACVALRAAQYMWK
jgi:hypothetical protein